MIKDCLSSIEIIVGENINNVLKQRNIKIFDDRIVKYLSIFSSLIQKEINNDNDLIAFAGFAFWIRESNLLRLKGNYKDFEKRFGRGVSLHITPSNIVTNSLYSFAFGLLSGCPSIVRISSKNKDIIRKIIGLIRTNEISDKFCFVEKLYSFITYQHSDEINNYLSKKVDVRLLWGGDQTIDKFKSYETKSTCIDLPFPNRTSSAYIEMEALNKLTSKELDRISEALAKDIFIFAQRACSSPFLIYVNINKLNEYDLTNFFKIVNNKIKNYNGSILKYSILDHFKGSADLTLNVPNNSKAFLISDYLTVIKINQSEIDKLINYKPFYGCLVYIPIESIEQLSTILPTSNQTCILIPFSDEIANNIMQIVGPLGTNRLVRAGDSVNMHLFWDGYDIVGSLSQYVQFY